MNKNKNLLLLGALVTVLIGVIGFSFAYFVSGVAVEGKGTNAGGTTKAEFLTTEYDAGEETLSFPDAIPGLKKSKSFKVNITPTTDDNHVKYVIKLAIPENGNQFTKCTVQTADNECKIGAKELVYTLTRQIDGGEREILKSQEDITEASGEVILATEEFTYNDTNTHVYSYQLEIEFIDTDQEQNHNVGKSLSGEVKVEYSA